ERWDVPETVELRALAGVAPTNHFTQTPEYSYMLMTNLLSVLERGKNPISIAYPSAPLSRVHLDELIPRFENVISNRVARRGSRSASSALTTLVTDMKRQRDQLENPARHDISPPAVPAVTDSISFT